jgi:[NiFe] hydrogenase assembly HybE family chaperone
VCWWLYDPDVGDDEAQVAPGVAFQDLPEDYTCPRCHAPKARFLVPVEDPVGRLVEAYRAIDLRMQDLPIHNPRLVVEAIGFRAVGSMLVGALVTPWFVNLVVFGLPLPPGGESVEVELPAGCFLAMGASPSGVAHLAISLASPVLHLADQVAARAFADESLRLVLTPKPEAPASDDPPLAPRTTGRRALFAGLLGD